METVPLTMVFSRSCDCDQNMRRVIAHSDARIRTITFDLVGAGEYLWGNA